MTPVTQGRGTDMLLKYIPHWLIVLHFDIGHFHWDLGVTKT